MSSQTVKAIPRRKTREEILELSAPLFARHGYDGVSMRDVAAAVGLTQAALYYHFSDKDQLYLDAVTCEFQEKEAALKAMLAGNGTPWERLERFVAGLARMMAYLSRYTHRVAISNRRLVSMDENGVSFRWKDYRAKGRTRHKTMTLAPEGFMRRFLLHVLPSGFHRIRHYGLLANAGRRVNLTRVRTLLNVPPPEPVGDETAVMPAPTFVCRCCGATMRVVEIVRRRQPIRAPP